MLTVEDASAHIKHALGGMLLEDLDPLYIINETGQRLTAMRAWNWLIRPQVLMSLVANQEYLTPVPDDFGEIVTIEYVAGLTARVIQSNFHVIAQYRSQAFASPGYLLYVAISHAPDTSGVPKPRFEIYPTPLTSQPDTIKMFYRARWTNLEGADSALIPVPVWMEPLFIQVLRAVALGYQKEDEASMSMRLRDVIGGPDWQFAARSDASEQTNRGPLRGGSLQTAWGYDDFEWLLQNQILPPTAT
jgi:hypothetical protein